MYVCMYVRTYIGLHTYDMDDVTLGRSVPYDDAWKAKPLTYYHYRRCDTAAQSGAYECLVRFVSFCLFRSMNEVGL